MCSSSSREGPSMRISNGIVTIVYVSQVDRITVKTAQIA